MKILLLTSVPSGQKLIWGLLFITDKLKPLAPAGKIRGYASLVPLAEAVAVEEEVALSTSKTADFFFPIQASSFSL